MTPEEAQAMVQDLMEAINGGYTLVTWNGLTLAFPVLAKESGLEAECHELASQQVDMMFHVYCIKGQYLDLATAASGMGLPLRSTLPVSEDPSRVWAPGEHQQALAHLSERLRTTVDVASSCEDRKVLLWTNKRGGAQGMDLPAGWLTAPEVARVKGIDHTQWRWDR